MDPKDVETKLVEVLQRIQSDSGYDGKPIEGTICPVSDLEGFESLLWPVAICMLETALGLKTEIPLTTNIFFSQDGKRPLTIRESADRVCEIVILKENER